MPVVAPTPVVSPTPVSTPAPTSASTLITPLVAPAPLLTPIFYVNIAGGDDDNRLRKSTVLAIQSQIDLAYATANAQIVKAYKDANTQLATRLRSLAESGSSSALITSAKAQAAKMLTDAKAQADQIIATAKLAAIPSPAPTATDMPPISLQPGTGVISKSITCKKGFLTMVVKGLKPICPTGYSLKK